jgi:hypothetical protein
MVLPKPAAPCRASPGRTKPSRNVYCRTSPNQTCSRENSREGEPSVLPSAVLAARCRTRASPSMPDLTVPCRGTSTLKREQQGASEKAPYCRLQSLNHRTPPGLARTHPSRPLHAVFQLAISTLQREQQREPKPPVLLSAAVASPHLASPVLASPLQASLCLTASYLDS